ncbi:UNVERIFIED_CONTAM: Retrovirus-related Pol polyprotein from transposon RE1 [Sesamum indicum]
MTSLSSEIPEVPFTTSGVGNEHPTMRMSTVESQGMIMVSAPFSGGNWLSWSRSVRMALESKDKLGFIDGSALRPAIGTPQYKQWRITDCTVRTWILNTISKDLVNAYLYANSSRDLWMELEARYGECDGTLLYKLQREISSISQGNMSVTVYYTKLKQLWDELVCLMPPAICSCGLCVCGCNKTKAEQNDASQLIQFLMGLNDSYDTIRSQILVLEPLPLVNKAYSMVLRVERQRMVNSEYSDAGEASAMKAYEYKHNSSLKNFARNGKGPLDKRHLFCEHCNRNGHSKESCFKLHGFPDWYKELRDQRKKQSSNGRAYAVVDATQSSIEASNSNGVQLMSELLDALRMVQNKIPQDPVNVHFAQVDEMAGMTMEYSTLTGCNANSWIVDTGATCHMCGDVKLFHSLTVLKAPKRIHLPDNSITLATQCGDIQLCPKFILTNVLLVPSFTHNLLSVSQLCSSLNLSFSFHNSFCVLQDLKSDRVLAIGKQHKHLYYLEPLSFTSVSAHIFSAAAHSLPSSCVTDNDDFILWHQRLGHSSPDVMKRIATLQISTPHKEHICNICPLAKQTRIPFCLSTTKIVSCFDLIHVDIWGPYKQATMSGAHYVLTIVDDFSRATWTFLMRHKSQTLVTLTTFFAQILTQFSCKIKSVRTDNGSEFVSSSCQSFFRNQGVLHQKSCTYTPQQNGVVERKHRHLLEVARALMFQSHLPNIFWGDSILTATHIINKLPTPTLNWKSPFEVLHNTPPTYEHLKSFGCLCFASNFYPSKSKFDCRAFECVFLGYVPHQKGYKVFDFRNHRTLISRDVRFHETVFPFKSIAAKQIQPTIPLPSFDSDSFLAPAPPSTIQSPCSTHDSSVPTTDSTTPLHPTNSTTPLHVAAPSSPPRLRRSLRVSQPPAWLHDFICHSSHNSTCAFTSSHSGFQAALSTIREPRCYNQAKDSVEWQQAMQNELLALEQNQTWEVTDLPPNKRLIGCKWVYKVKLNPDGSVERYKARLVAKGYSQVEGVDYFDRFSPVAKVVTVRVFLTVATGSHWAIHQVDINNAFLHGFLEEDIYMEAPAGYDIPSGKCCRLKRSLYGLKQASRQWNQELTNKLLQFGFAQSLNDYCLFIKGSGTSLIFLLVYVDDLLITGPSESLIQEVKMFLDTAFSIKDLGYAKYFLGLEIARSPSGTSVTQHKYIRDIVADAGFDQCKPAPTPLPLGLKLSSQSSPTLDDPEPFRRLVGRLLYLGFTRPDISCAAQQLSQFVHAPCQIHMDAALHLVRYLAGCPDLGLFIPTAVSSVLTAYCDADWASCVDTRRSLTGYCIFLGDALISWKTKKQSTVSRSTAEAEYRSLGATVCELQWLASLLQDFHINVSTPISLFCDNQAALHIVANPVFHERTKHLEIDCHLIRDKFKSGFILPSHIPGKLQLADVFTKSLPGPSFASFLSKLGLLSLTHAQLEGGLLQSDPASTQSVATASAANSVSAPSLSVSSFL